MKKFGKYIFVLLFVITILISVCFIPISVSRFIPLVEEQIENNIGVKAHIEKLVIQIGPSLKLKTPILHLMYPDGQKIAQLDAVKMYISWDSLLRKAPVLKTIRAKKINIKIFSDDKYLEDILNKLNTKEFQETPNVKFKEYKFSYLNKENNDIYLIEGHSLVLEKIYKFKNYKLKTNGTFLINSNKHISYDFVIVPNIELIRFNNKNSILSYIEQIKELDFCTDIIADLKIYRNSAKNIQASGFINIDNMSVLDRNKKNPKSFIYLTLWGDKASILSNIYTSQNKKIYTEGMINNSQKPVLDLKVKTDEIDINDFYKKIKVLLNYSYIKNIKEINGKLNANFILKGDLNKIKSNGFIKITDASIVSNGLNIEKINSEIDLSNNTINIKNAIGYVNDSPIIVKGLIDKNINIELLMNKVELKHLLPENLGVKDGVISLITKINGTFDKISHKEKLLIENLKYINKNIDLSLTTVKLDTNENNIAHVNNVLIKTPYTEHLKIPSLKVLIEPELIKIPETNIFMPNSKISFKGNIINCNGNDMNFASSLSGYINSKDITKLSNNSTKYPVKVAVNGNKFTQNINAQLFLEKPEFLEEPALLNFNSKYEKNSLKIEDFSLISYTGALSEDFKVNTKGNKKLIITGVIDDIKSPVMKNLRIFIPQILNLSIFDTIAQIKGDFFVNGDFKTPEIVGQINIQNLINQTLQLIVSNCTVDFNKNNIILNVPQLKLADSTVGLNALLTTNFIDNFQVKNINIKSKYLNADTILMYKDSPIMKLYPIKIQEGKFYSEKVFMTLYGTPVYLSALTSDLNLADNILSLKNLSTEVYNGKINGDIIYNLKDEHFKAKLMARAVSAEPIFSILSSRKDHINGIMDFDANISGELITKKSLVGDVRFVINNGRMSSLGKLEHLLYAQNVIADNMLRTSLSVVTKALTLKDTGLFKFLRGEIDIENGIANIKMLQSQGPSMSLFIKGKYNFLNDYANLLVLGRISDEIVTGLGVFGDFSFNKLMIMLTGEETKQEILPEDFNKLPQLQAKNTKEFRALINGIIDKPVSVVLFNWISYSQKSLKQKEVPMNNANIPDFINALPY